MCKKKRQTTETEKALFGKIFYAQMIKKNGVLLQSCVKIKPLNKREDAYIVTINNQIKHQGTNLTKACEVFENLVEENGTNIEILGS